ncbi:hypothetical protein KC330_g8067 [Hortaea werneckii]|nr:hypothetical protein KC330_g8067 [Hortaea werneckii]
MSAPSDLNNRLNNLNLNNENNSNAPASPVEETVTGNGTPEIDNTALPASMRPILNIVPDCRHVIVLSRPTQPGHDQRWNCRTCELYYIENCDLKHVAIYSTYRQRRADLIRNEIAQLQEIECAERARQEFERARAEAERICLEAERLRLVEAQRVRDEAERAREEAEEVEFVRRLEEPGECALQIEANELIGDLDTNEGCRVRKAGKAAAWDNPEEVSAFFAANARINDDNDQSDEQQFEYGARLLEQFGWSRAELKSERNRPMIFCPSEEMRRNNEAIGYAVFRAFSQSEFKSIHSLIRGLPKGATGFELYDTESLIFANIRKLGRAASNVERTRPGSTTFKQFRFTTNRTNNVEIDTPEPWAEALDEASHQAAQELAARFAAEDGVDPHDLARFQEESNNQSNSEPLDEELAWFRDNPV